MQLPNLLFCAILCLCNQLRPSFLLTQKPPTILISFLARNKAHTLPYFLSNLQQLNYPKKRIALWLASDYNSDATIEILRYWLNSVKDDYHSIQTNFIENVDKYPDESGPAHWSKMRFDHVINLRDSALEYGRSIWADYFLSIDCDVFLTNPDTLLHLIRKKVTVVAPMFNSEGLYSNYWHGMTDDYYYHRTDGYKPILHREKIGCFVVPMIHSCVLIDLRIDASDTLTYVPHKVSQFDGPIDDIITFAIAANRSNIPLHLCNEEPYGFVMVPLEQNDQLDVDFEQLTNLKLEILNHQQEKLFVYDDLRKRFLNDYTKDTLGFDEIYMINLLRRPERRKRMIYCFDELGLRVNIFDAIDGKALNTSILNEIQILPEYADPYHKRSMTLGEIGCFLSHYRIWENIVNNNNQMTLILEDDIRFEPFFRTKVKNLLIELNKLPQWDLVYFGRKRLQENDEPWVEGSNLLVEAGYSYWTLGYALSLQGAKKLLNADPLAKLVPVDEYLPILFDKHPQNAWKAHFPQRDLIALSASPLLIYPTHYTGESGYISDTEDSAVVKEFVRDDL